METYSLSARSIDMQVWGGAPADVFNQDNGGIVQTRTTEVGVRGGTPAPGRLWGMQGVLWGRRFVWWRGEIWEEERAELVRFALEQLPPAALRSLTATPLGEARRSIRQAAADRLWLRRRPARRALGRRRLGPARRDSRQHPAAGRRWGAAAVRGDRRGPLPQPHAPLRRRQVRRRPPAVGIAAGDGPQGLLRRRAAHRSASAPAVRSS